MIVMLAGAGSKNVLDWSNMSSAASRNKNETPWKKGIQTTSFQGI
jgi:hypothetical protein